MGEGGLPFAAGYFHYFGIYLYNFFPFGGYYRYSQSTQKAAWDLRGSFSTRKADSAGRLAPDKEKNTRRRKEDRKDELFSGRSAIKSFGRGPKAQPSNEKRGE